MGRSVGVTTVLSRAGRITAILALITALPGCFLWTTRGEGDNQAKRIAELEDGSKKSREEFDAQLALAKQQVAELQKVLAQATNVVTRNSADLGVKVGELETQIARLEGEIAELRNQSTQASAALDGRLESIARKAGVDMPVDPSLVPSDMTAHWSAAVAALQNNDHSNARGLFREYIKRYGTDTKAGEAQFNIGKSYMTQGKQASALGEFRNVLTNYGSSDKADDALYEMASAFWVLQSCNDARTALDALVQKFPSSPLAKTAKALRKTWTKPPAGYCQDTK